MVNGKFQHNYQLVDVYLKDDWLKMDKFRTIDSFFNRAVQGDKINSKCSYGLYLNARLFVI